MTDTEGQGPNNPYDANDARVLLPWELAELREAGYQIGDLEPEVAQAIESGDEAWCRRMLEELAAWPRSGQGTLDEPGDFAALSACWSGMEQGRAPLGKSTLADRIWAAWAGRIAGCMLGKPVEGWPPAQLRSYLDLAHAYPLSDYIPALDPMPAGCEFDFSWTTTVRGSFEESTRDDDIDFTILGLITLETKGRLFRPEDVGDVWMTYVPYLSLYTAERVAYRNLVAGLRPPETAIHLNPYREWIGAQIRADMWGYVNPGRPSEAAEMAFRDATLSHTRNGVYAAMWAAALIAACFTSTTMREALAISLRCIPSRSRLAAALKAVADRFDAGSSWDDTRSEIEQTYSSYHWVHSVNNAALVAASLLWGEGDYSRTVGLTVEGGWDTDSNGATAGSAFGAMHGREGIPSHWLAPIHNRVRSAVKGFDGLTIDELAARTMAIAAW
jgi:ADP-ribosylglycohydrolase